MVVRGRIAWQIRTAWRPVIVYRMGPVTGLAKIMSRLGMGAGEESPGHAAAALEFALEGLYLMRRLSKEDLDGVAVYRT